MSTPAFSGPLRRKMQQEAEQSVPNLSFSTSSSLPNVSPLFYFCLCRNKADLGSSMEQFNQEEETEEDQGRLDFNAPIRSLRTRRNGGHGGSFRLENTPDLVRHDEEEVLEWASPRSDLYMSSDSNLGSLRIPGSVPFVWEQSPGRPKNKNRETYFEATPMPSLPPGRTMSSPAHHRLSVFSPKHAGFPESAAQLKKVEPDKIQPRRLIALESTAEDSETFSDAADTLDQNDTIASTCKVSLDERVSLDQQEDNPLQIPTELYNDPAARDFIMRRFLPAAKAMADEPMNPSAMPSITQIIPSMVRSQPEREMQKVTLAPTPPRPPPKKPSPKLSEFLINDDDVVSNYDEAEFKNKACGMFCFRLGALRHLKYGSRPLRSAQWREGRSKLLPSNLQKSSSSADYHNAVEDQEEEFLTDEEYEDSDQEDDSNRHPQTMVGGRQRNVGTNMGYLSRSIDSSCNYMDRMVGIPEKGSPRQPKGFLGMPKDRCSHLHKEGNYYPFHSSGDWTTSEGESTLGSSSPSSIRHYAEQQSYLDARLGRALTLNNQAGEFKDGMNKGQEVPSNTSGAPFEIKEGWPLALTKQGIQEALKSNSANDMQIAKSFAPNILPPPLPKSPSQPWLWHANSAVASSPLRSHSSSLVNKKIEGIR